MASCAAARTRSAASPSARSAKRRAKASRRRASRWLARPQVDRGQPVGAQKLRDLAAVERVVTEHPKQDRAAGMDARDVAVRPLERNLEHVLGPRVEAALDQRARGLEGPDELVSRAWVIGRVLPAKLVERVGKRRRIGTRFAEHAT